jgi:hypothetical protein
MLPCAHGDGEHRPITMRWLGVRKAKIPQDMRDAFEQAGTMQIQALLFHGWINRDGLPDTLQRVSTPGSSVERQAALEWLTEKGDVAELRETWNLTMEAAITVLVLVSVALDVALLFKK